MADRRLRVFYTVARLLSFTRAAEALHMTQPAVTFQIRQLEDYFDTRLFDRAHNRVRLTAAGRKVYQYAERILELYAEMEQALKAPAPAVNGTLTLGASAPIIECLLRNLLRDFKREYPGLDLRLKLADDREILPMVESGEIDVGAVESNTNAENLQLEPGLADHMVVIAPPRHPLAGHDCVNPEALARYPFVCRDQNCRTGELIMKYMAATGLSRDALNISLELGSFDAIKDAVEAGMGIAIVPRSSIGKELELGTLAAVRLDPPLERSFFFVSRPGDSHAAEALLKFWRNYGRE